MSLCLGFGVKRCGNPAVSTTEGRYMTQNYCQACKDRMNETNEVEAL